MLEEGLEVPFIVRYRAARIGEMSGPLGHSVRKAWESHSSLAKLRAKVLKAAETSSDPGDVSERNGNRVSHIRNLILEATTAGELEDLYAPFKPPAKGTLAERARGIPGLGAAVDSFWNTGATRLVSAIVHGSKDETATKGLRAAAVALLSSKIAALPNVWSAARKVFDRLAVVTSKKKKKAGEGKEAATMTKMATNKPKGKAPGAGAGHSSSTYENFEAPLRSLRAHQCLALQRGKAREDLAVSIGVGTTIPPNTTSTRTSSSNGSSNNSGNGNSNSRSSGTGGSGGGLSDNDVCLSVIRREVVGSGGGLASSSPDSGHDREWGGCLLEEAVLDAWSRSLKRRCAAAGWRDALGKANSRAVEVFCDNLSAALLAPCPLSAAAVPTAAAAAAAALPPPPLPPPPLPPPKNVNDAATAADDVIVVDDDDDEDEEECSVIIIDDDDDDDGDYDDESPVKKLKTKVAVATKRNVTTAMKTTKKTTDIFEEEEEEGEEAGGTEGFYVLALDPGFSAGCKCALLDCDGNLVPDSPTPSELSINKSSSSGDGREKSSSGSSSSSTVLNDDHRAPSSSSSSFSGLFTVYPLRDRSAAVAELVRRFELAAAHYHHHHHHHHRRRQRDSGGDGGVGVISVLERRVAVAVGDGTGSRDALVLVDEALRACTSRHSAFGPPPPPLLLHKGKGTIEGKGKCKCTWFARRGRVCGALCRLRPQSSRACPPPSWGP